MLTIETVRDATDEVVEAMSRLLPQLSAGPFPDRAALQAVADDPGSVWLVARDHSGWIVGTLTLVIYRTPMAVHAWIEDVVVDENDRRQGVGQALTRFAIQCARARGARAIHLTSRPTREAANRLYQHLGFLRWETNLYRLPLED